jgi:osmotically-inducible protein OsmY
MVCLTDDAIADAAANALTWYRAVAANTVSVSVENGWVTLTGIVADLQQRGAAERAVRGLRGVRGVSNMLTVVRPPCAMPLGVEAALAIADGRSDV